MPKTKAQTLADRQPTHIHPSVVPGIQVEVHDSMDGFWFRLRVHDKVSQWTGYSGIATVIHKGACYITHSAYYGGHFFPDVTEMTVLKVDKLFKGISE